MIHILVASVLGFLLSVVGTRHAVNLLHRQRIGEFVPEGIEGHPGHMQGTPTMGGTVVVVAAVIGWMFTHFQPSISNGGQLTLSIRPFGAGGWLAALAVVGMALVGFLDEWLKYKRERSLGLSKAAKFGGQLAVAAIFGYLASGAGAVTEISFLRPLGIDLGVFFFVWVFLLMVGTSTGVRLSDGIDGLTGGSSVLVVGAYVVIAFWQFRYSDAFLADAIYEALSPLELATIAAAMFGAILGFLWWNAPPAKIIMGEAGSLGIGGLLAALALLTNTQLLLPVVGVVFLAEAVSLLVQAAVYRFTGTRVLKMSPLHFHFVRSGWSEPTVVVRFWILTFIGVAIALGLFYSDFLQQVGLL